MKKLLAICCLVTLLAGVDLAKADTITFFDGTFSSWSLTSIHGTQTGSRITTGGNPGDYWKVTTTTAAPVYSMSTDPGVFSYDPALGAIDSIDFSFDFLPITTFGEGQGVGIVLRQGGAYFAYGAGITGLPSTSWQSKGGSGLLATSFVPESGSGTINFSALGGKIDIGLWTWNSGGNTIAVGYDNFKVTLNTAVPTPSSFAALIGMGLVGLVGVARRRWKK